MVKYLLDTCIVIAVLRGDEEMQSKIESVGIQNCFISEITMAELYCGPEKLLTKNSQRDKTVAQKAKQQLSSLKELPNILKVLPWQSCSQMFAHIHELLNCKGERIEDMDLMLASFALSNDFILVTGNLKHFSRIPGLKTENWFRTL